MSLEKISIEGGHRLKGTVNIGGAKNAALPIMCLPLLTEQSCQIQNVPNLLDVKGLKQILSYLGAEITVLTGSELSLNAKHVQAKEAPYDMVRKMRASVLLLGPMLARFGEAKISLPGGCAIGVRPIDQHLKALEAMGAKVFIENGYIIAKAKQLVGASFRFDVATVTGTMNALMAASLAKGETVLRHCAKEPEVTQLCEMLQCMGCELEGIGSDTIKIVGQSSLKGFSCHLIPDRIEAGTYAVAAAMTGGDVFLSGCRLDHLKVPMQILEQSGASCVEQDKGLWIRAEQRLQCQSIVTEIFPGFPTDLQAQFMAMMSISVGTCKIEEKIFENRFMHVPELNRMGARIKIKGSTAYVEGVANLTAAPVMATDLRASAGLLLAGLVAKGTTDVMRVYHLDRGYESMEIKLSKLGANIVRRPQDL